MPGQKFDDENGLDDHTQNVYKCSVLKRAALNADKNVNRLELGKLRTGPGYDAGPHILWHRTALEHCYCSTGHNREVSLKYTLGRTNLKFSK